MQKFIFLLIFFTFLLSANAQIVINEIHTTNVSGTMNPVSYNFSNWIELYNPYDATFSTANLYLTNSETEFYKWRIPTVNIKPKECFIIWFDAVYYYNHAPFDILSKGGTLILHKSTGEVIERVDYPYQYPNISYGRQKDGASEFTFFGNPTPGRTNSTNGSNTITAQPIFSLQGGIYSSSQTLNLSHPNSAVTIYYTTDGSEPTTNSLIYSTAISIVSTKVVRAMAIAPNSLPSEIKTQSYIISNRMFNLPVVCLSTNSAFLWDDMIGMYVAGKNGVAGRCTGEPKNWNRDWERPVNIEYYDAEGKLQINQYAGLRMAGNCSRTFAPLKSLCVLAKTRYGEAKLNYRFFADKNIEKFDAIVLRNSGNDWDNSVLRDGLMQTLISQYTDIDYNAYKPSVVFINGQYFGILNIRERTDDDYVASNYNISDDSFDLLENNATVIRGSNTEYNNLLSYMGSNNMSNLLNLNYVANRIDMKQYMDYMIAQIYFANTDWPGNNIKYWKSKYLDNKWRWILFDTDFGMGLMQNANHNTINFCLEANGPVWPNPAWSTFFFRKLSENQTFRIEFAERFAHYLNTIFLPQNISKTVDSLANNIRYELPYHFERWGKNPVYWENNLNNIKLFGELRYEVMLTHLATYIGKSQRVNLVIQNDTEKGYVDLNGKYITAPTFEGTYFSSESLVAQPVCKFGYTFKGWEVDGLSTETQIIVNQLSEWQYWDKGTEPVGAWETLSYDDETWSKGNAIFGYGDNRHATLISFGSNEQNKYITTYFRKKFTISKINPLDTYETGIAVDDGAVVYINGKEVFRHNLPTGEINFNTLALTAIGGDDEIKFVPFSITADMLVEGENIVAVELHQVGAGSSDLGFDLQIKRTVVSSATSELNTNSNLVINMTGDVQIKPIFSKIDQNTLYINEFMASNGGIVEDTDGSSPEWIELCNSGETAFDISGLYLTNNSTIQNMWKIPQSDMEKMILKPQSHLVFFADGMEYKEINHTNFNLNNNGGEIAIFQKIDNQFVEIDKITYQNQKSDVSFGKYPDGTGFWHTMPRTTPKLSNVAPNSKPQIISASPQYTLNNGDVLLHQIIAIDADNETLTFEIQNKPLWLQLVIIDGKTAELRGIADVSKPTDYQIIVTVSDGINSPVEKQLLPIKVNYLTSFESVSLSDFKLYPNPATESIYWQLPNEEVAENIKIVDMNGRYFEKHTHANYISINDLADGLYFIFIQTKKNTYKMKFIVE